MERGKENEGEREKGEANNSSVSSAVLCKDIVNLLDFIERLKNRGVQELTLELTFMSAFFQLYSFIPDFDAEMSCISYEIHDLVQSIYHPNGDDMLVKLKDHVIPRLLENIKSYIRSHHFSELISTVTEDQLVELLNALLVNLHYIPKCCAEFIFPLMTQYELLQHVCGNLRDFHELKVNGCIEHETIEYVLPQFQFTAVTVGYFCFVLLASELDITDEIGTADEFDKIRTVSQVDLMIAELLVDIIPVQLEVMHICSTNLKASKSADVGRFIKQLLEASSNILREYLIHLQQHMVNVITTSTSTQNIHVMIEFLLIILTDVADDFVHCEKLFDLLSHVGELTREVSTSVVNLEGNSKNEEKINMNENNVLCLKEDLKNIYLKSPNPPEIYFPMSDGPLYMTLLLRNLNDLLNSNAYSVALIKDEIRLVKQDLELIRSFFGNAEQELHRDIWIRVLDVAYEAEHAINSILVRDHCLLQLIFLLPDVVEKIKFIKEEVYEKICKNMCLVVANSSNMPVESNSSAKLIRQIIVGFDEETNLIIRQLTGGPAELDVISIIGMPGSGKTTLAYKVYNDKAVTSHFDICAWCTVDQRYDWKRMLQKIYNQVTGLDARFSEDFNVGDELRRKLYGRRYLIVLDDLWDTATWDELTMPFQDLRKGSRIILTSRIKEVALHGKCHSEPLYLRLLTLGESWELLEKRVFGGERCPDELLDVGEEIARKCDGLPLVLDLICGVLAKKEKKKALWLEVLTNLNFLKNEEEVMKVIQLSYDHLGDHLKPCLLHLASFPKDKDIKITELKDLWSAEGLVEQTEMRRVEEVMEVYLDELISSSLVIVFNERVGRDLSFQIHDLVHDFCLEKARKEKLFHLSSSSAPPSSSSSDLMPRGITFLYDLNLFNQEKKDDQHLHYSDENLVLFNPEKKNPCVKYLLSLKVYDVRYGHVDCLPDNCHLRHLRLLKRLELPKTILTDFLLDEIGMLVHLRCLNIVTKAKALPLSFSNLWNLETLKVDNLGSDHMVLSPSIWSLAKLRHLRIRHCSVFDSDISETTMLEEVRKLENLRMLDGFEISVLADKGDNLKRFPNLRNLKFTIKLEPWFRFPRLDVLNELEEVCAKFDYPVLREHEWDCHFPSSLKKLELSKFSLTCSSLSRIARLPNLQNLTLTGLTISGKEWNTEEVTFENLKILRLRAVYFSEWLVGEESFPVLEELQIILCDELKEIPESFGDIASLKSISLWGSRQLKDSALKVKEYVADMTGEEDKLEVLLDPYLL